MDLSCKTNYTFASLTAMKITTIAIIAILSALDAQALDLTTLDGAVYKNAVVTSREGNTFNITYEGGVMRIDLLNVSPEMQQRFGVYPDGAPTPRPTPVPGEIKLKDGTIVKGEVQKFIPESIDVKTEKGTINILCADLDENYCVMALPKSNYAYATKLKDEMVVGLANMARATEENIKSLPTPAPTPILRDGINILEFNARPTERSTIYVHVSWKVVLFNNTTEDMTEVPVRFYFLDKDGYELSYDLQTDVILPPYKRVTVTGNTMMKTSVWSQVDAYRVKTGR